MTNRQRSLLSIFVLYAVSVGAIKLLYELRFLPFLNAMLWSVALLVQVYVPVWVMHREYRTVSYLGLHGRRWGRSLLWFVLAAGLFFPASIFGHHLWQRSLGHSLQVDAYPFHRFNPSARGKPPKAKSSEEVQLYSTKDGRELYLRWRAPLHGTIESNGPLQIISGWSWVRGKRLGNRLRIAGGTGGSPLQLRLKPHGTWIRFRLTRDGKPLPVKEFRLGSSRSSMSSPAVSRSLWWVVILILTQLLMVALPEELFYRGLLLTKLEGIWMEKGWDLFGFRITQANLVVSVLFALTHFLIGHQFYRFGVFFPSLAFGILKRRTGSLLAPILFHAASNVLMKLLEILYH